MRSPSAHALSIAISVSVYVMLADPARASIVVNSSSLACGVIDPALNSDVVHFQNVPSPFHNSHQAQLGISTAGASYDLVFDNQSLDYHSTGVITAQGSPPIFRSGCETRIRITTDADLLLDLDWSYAWNLPSGDRTTSWGLSVVRASPNTWFYDDGRTIEPIFGDPRIGNAEGHLENFFLPGGATYHLAYFFLHDNFGGNPSQLSRGDIRVDINLTTIPEPAALLLLACAGPLLRRRMR